MDRERLKTLLILLPVALVMLVAGIYLLQDLKGSRLGANPAGPEESPVGYSVRLESQVKRKGVSASYWSDVAKSEPIYNRDTLRTGPLSSVKIHLNDGTEIEIDENSLIIFERRQNEMTASLELGELSAKAGSSPFVVEFANKKVSALNSEIELNFDAQKNGQVTVQRGQATLADQNHKYVLSPQKMARIQPSGAISEVELSVRLKTPKNNATLVANEDQVPALFSWEVNQPAQFTRQELEISPTPNFSAGSRLVKANQQAETLLKSGRYWWRVRATDQSGRVKLSETRVLVVQRDVRLQITAPAAQTKFQLEKEEGSVDLAWVSSLPADHFTVELSSNPDFSHLYPVPVVRESSVRVGPLHSGTYVWRVRAFDTSNHELAHTGSSNFTLAFELPVGPALIRPRAHYRWTLPDSLRFEWQAWNSATQYRILISKNSDFSEVVKSDVITDRFYLWRWTQPGNYFWSIEALASDGHRLAVSQHETFLIAADSRAQIKLVQPTDQQKIMLQSKTKIPFRWTTQRSVGSAFSIHIYEGVETQNHLVDAEIKGTRYEWTAPHEGTFYWNVTWTNPKDDSDHMQSATDSFQVTAGQSLPAPTLIQPLVEEHRTLERDEPVDVSWSTVEGAVSYTLKLERWNPDQKKWDYVSEKSATTPSLKTDALAPGTYQVWVIPQNATGQDGLSSTKRRFHLEPSKGLAAPVLKAPVIK